MEADAGPCRFSSAYCLHLREDMHGNIEILRVVLGEWIVYEVLTHLAYNVGLKNVTKKEKKAQLED